MDSANPDAQQTKCSNSTNVSARLVYTELMEFVEVVLQAPVGPHLPNPVFLCVGALQNGSMGSVYVYQAIT